MNAGFVRFQPDYNQQNVWQRTQKIKGIECNESKKGKKKIEDISFLLILFSKYYML